MAQLKKWKAKGDRLIICLDANKDIYKKSIGKALTDTNGISMKEIVGEFTGRKIGPTFFRGSKPIDGVWAMANIEISNACVMPAGYGIGDHRMFIVNLVQSSMIGETPCQIQRLVSHRLNTKVPGGGTAKYIATLESSLARHRLIKHLGRAYEKSKLKKALCRRLNKINRESKELMKNAEKTCQRIKSGRIPFSPEAALWIRRALVYRSLLRYHLGLIRNRGNLKQWARRCGIPNCLSILVVEVRLRLRAATEHCDYYRKHGKYYQTKHLYQCLANAREAQQETREKGDPCYYPT